MKILNFALLLTICAAAAAVAQGDRGANTTPTSNSTTFSWQQQQRQAEELKEKYASQIADLSDAEWRETALAMMEFEAGQDDLLFTDVVRIGGAIADKKAVTEHGTTHSEDSPSWVVRFGKKTPRKLTLTLTDPNSTEVQCKVAELLQTGEGYVGVFLVDAVLMCVTRSTAIG